MALTQAERNRKWRIENPERRRELKAASYLRHREAVKGKTAAWAAANPARIAAYAAKRGEHYQANKQHYCALTRSWQVRNSGKVNFYAANRRKACKQATPPWANKFFMEEAYALAALRTELFGFAWHVDHVIPLKGKTVCGLHVETNLAVIPWQDNLKKKNSFNDCNQLHKG